MENRGTTELLGIFEFSMKTRSKSTLQGQLPHAWGKLFSDLYLSQEDLVAEMQMGEYRFDYGKVQMLREFIRGDCASGGFFVLNVIKNGGNIDRAALFMIANLGDLIEINDDGKPAIHLLIDACDKRVRPALIRKAGKRLLSQVYDRWGIPAIFSIFRLCDLTENDLNAIASVFSRDELKGVMSRSRTGNTAFDVFIRLSASLKRHPPLERNTFYRSAAKDTMMEGADSPVRIERITGAGVKDDKNRVG